MEYETTPRPIRTLEALADARAKGARIEYTACGPGRSEFEERPDTYEDTDDLPNGWITPRHDVVTCLGDGLRVAPWRLVRAFYPVQP